MSGREKLNKNKKLLCISSIDWNFIWQRHQTFMSGFADRGWQIDYIGNTYFRNPTAKDFIRLTNRLKGGSAAILNEVPSNVRLIKPQVVPPNGWLFRLLNRYYFIPRLLKQLDKHYDLVWIYMPSYTTRMILQNVDRNWTVFDFVAYFEG